MKKIMTNIVSVLFVIWMLAFPAYAEHYAQLHFDIDWQSQGFEKMYTTCYLIEGITATGVPTHYGVAACNTHVGEVAEIYTLEGEYLGMFIVADTGSSHGLVTGQVIDIWQPDMESAKEWMSITGGKCYVKFVKGEG